MGKIRHTPSQASMEKELPSPELRMQSGAYIPTATSFVIQNLMNIN